MKLYLVTNENGDAYHFVAENMAHIEKHYEERGVLVQEIKLVDDQVTIIR